MNTDVLFESGKTAAEAFNLIRDRGLINNIRYFISPFRPEGLDKAGFMLLLPYVFRSGNEGTLQRILDREKPERVLIRNMEELGYLRDKGFKGEIYADASLYSFNKESMKVLKDMGVCGFTCPYELNIHELKERGSDSSTLVIYGRTCLMVSAQCTYKTGSGKCKAGGDGFFSEIRDRKNTVFPVRHECSYCYNVIYNSVPLSLFREMEDIERADIESLRLDFTIESQKEAADILEAFIFKDVESLNSHIPQYTKGHFRKGVE